MSRFFDSEQVRESLFELEEIQQKIFSDLFNLPFFDSKKKKEHLDLMKIFLEKQKVFIFRLSLSNDPEAVEMKNKILESARMFGLKPQEDLNIFFEQLENSIKKLEETLDY